MPSLTSHPRCPDCTKAGSATSWAVLARRSSEEKRECELFISLQRWSQVEILPFEAVFKQFG
jgi:hypothetical protein